MYDRKVNGKTLTFCVSGQLWNRSLLMKDVETESLWSHLLGESVQGELKETRLETRPSDMLTWAAWKERHPETTVLNLSRTNQDYTKEFYADPAKFVVGFVGKFGIQHCSFATLVKQPVLNADARGLPLLIVFDQESTSALVFERKLEEQTLTFEPLDKGRLRDQQTGSTWERTGGVATDGPLKGKKLTPQVGIVSYTKAWRTFHPDSKEITSADAPPKRDSGEPLKPEPKGEPNSTPKPAATNGGKERSGGDSRRAPSSESDTDATRNSPSSF